LLEERGIITKEKLDLEPAELDGLCRQITAFQKSLKQSAPHALCLLLSAIKETLMEIEYIGEVLPDGKLSVDPSVARRLSTGRKMKVTLSVPEEACGASEPKQLSPAARRLLEGMKNAKSLGLPRDPHELSHSVLAEV
jgi:hypothetical protein